ncbi:hypothetical protein T492DRAFT_1100559 [Pavlovales sp. CCMP2436]|nr:hypothetical protein T492DRAFT_1100559 [Pavlovales sp. CCMP2436]
MQRLIRFGMQRACSGGAALAPIHRSLPHARCGASVLARACSGAAPAPPQADGRTIQPAPPQAEARTLVFEGPKAGILRTLKTCSVANLFLSLLSSPVAVLVSETGTPSTRALMMGIVVLFSVTTTAGLHIATKPYVLAIHRISNGRGAAGDNIPKLETSAEDIRLSIATVTFFGGSSARELDLAALGPASSFMIFANMSAAGIPYYVDPLGTVLDESTMAAVRTAADAPEPR